ncbi:MAG: di-trans,poly-cis-decaprenylcistransferase [Azoarcus sp.]|jgi:undecaprenyl diphosphate synthase|nr:di-trans,poly-cis-decaprenylcistransferase [Azoarcus sp.]
MANKAFTSSTQVVPGVNRVPRHIAIIMDGNGRWARKRFLPRVAGHTRGVEAVRGTIRAAIERGVEYLTLFAFSSENWRRPVEEVSFLMQLFIKSLQKEVSRLHGNGICFHVIGDRSRFDPVLVKAIEAAEDLTGKNTRLHLTVAANYGGRWDVLSAVNRILARQPGTTGISEEMINAELSMSFAPEPDLFIRTGGEQRISNFLLWQLAYSEFFFTDALWPDFNGKLLDQAIASYQERERRFGRTSDQLIAAKGGEVGRHA